VADYDKRIAGYRELERYAVENGATIPLLQSVVTLVRKKNLTCTKYGNGWVLPQTLQWS
jgi:peptide/nickel transport system substrate-binding protein